MNDESDPTLELYGRKVTVQCDPEVTVVKASEVGKLLDKVFKLPTKEERRALKKAAKKDKAFKQKPFRHLLPKVGRNEPCPCGKGKKYKDCCLLKRKMKK